MPTIFEDHSLGQSVPTSFEDRQIGEIVDPLFVENTHVSHVDNDNYSAFGLLATLGNGAYESFATPGNGAYESLAMTGNGTYTNPWATAHSDNHHFAPFVNTNHPRLAQSTSAAAVTYNDGMALLTAPNPYIWGPVTAERPMGEYIGADFQYPDPSLPMMSSFTANTNGTGYHGQFPANSLETQWGTAVELPNAFHAVDTDATPFNVGQPVLPRPKCTECNQTFGRQADLDRHAKIHQADSKVFQCQVEGCKYSSYRKDKLNEHVKRRHQASSAASTQL